MIQLLQTFVVIFIVLLGYVGIRRHAKRKEDKDYADTRKRMDNVNTDLGTDWLRRRKHKRDL